MVSPSAGFKIASLSVLVRRGGKKPLLVLYTSNIAEGLGVSVPMPIWAYMLLKLSVANSSNIVFFMFYIFLLC